MPLKSKESLDWWLHRNSLTKTKNPPYLHYNSSNAQCFHTHIFKDAPTKISLVRTPNVTSMLNHYRPYTTPKTQEEKRCNVIHHTIVALFLFVLLIGLMIWQIALVAVGLIGIAFFISVIPTIEGNVRDHKPHPY